MEEEDTNAWNVLATLCALAYAVCFIVAGVCQIAVNWKHRLVVAMSLDWVNYNILGYSCLAIYTSFMFFSSTVQEQFFDDHPDVDVAPVFFSDVVLAFVCLFLTIVLVWQCFIYRRFSASIGQKTTTHNSLLCVIVTAVGWVALFLSALLASLPGVEWWRVYDGVVFAGMLFIATSFVRYIPQVSVNFRRRSTQGWSKVLLVSEMIGATFLTFEVFFSTANAGTDFYLGKYSKLLLVGAIFFWSTVIIIQHLTCCSEKALETSRKERVKEQEFLQSRIMYDDYDHVKKEALGDFRVLEDYDPLTDGRVSSSKGRNLSHRSASTSSTTSSPPDVGAMSPLSALKAAAVTAGGAVIRTVSSGPVVNGNLERMGLLDFASDAESELDLGASSYSDFDYETNLNLNLDDDLDVDDDNSNFLHKA